QHRTAADFRFHRLDAFGHLEAQHAGHDLVRDLLRSDAQGRVGEIGVLPEEGDHHGDDQPGKGRPENPGAVAPQHIDVVFDIRWTPGNGCKGLLGSHNTRYSTEECDYFTMIWSPGSSRMFCLRFLPLITSL